MLYARMFSEEYNTVYLMQGNDINKFNIQAVGALNKVTYKIKYYILKAGN